MDNIWQQEWNDGENGAHYRAVQPTVNNKIKYYARSRHKETLITRLRLGHCGVNKLLHGLQIVKDDKCATCQIKEDTQHLFFDCPRQADLQLQLQMLGATDLKSALSIPACTDSIYTWASENNVEL